MVERFTKTDAAFLVAKIISVLREKKGADVPLLVAEWHDALRFYDPALINAAWRHHRDTSPWWPTPADILDHVRANMPRAVRPVLKSEAYEFCREGRSVIEEQAHRAAQILDMKRQARVAFPEVKEAAE